MNQNHVPFSDMEDDIPFGDMEAPAPKDYLDAAREYAQRRVKTQYTDIRERNLPTDRAEHLYTEDCPACKGSGQFRSYTGRIVGECFKCQGKGKLTFKTSAETRAKGREASARAKVRQAMAISEAVAAFKKENAAQWAWLEANSGSFEFAESLNEQLHRRGELSQNQLAAIDRCIARDIEREAAKRAERAQTVANAPEADGSKLEAAFQHAMASGLKHPSLYFQGFRFSPASARSANAGAIYAKAHDGTYLGKVMNGKFLKSRDCDADDEAGVLRVVNDPFAAAVEHGRLTGHCCVCNRLLTDPDSVARGIGPICAERFGWL